jgi:hypothetical protein
VFTDPEAEPPAQDVPMKWARSMPSSSRTATASATRSGIAHAAASCGFVAPSVPAVVDVDESELLGEPFESPRYRRSAREIDLIEEPPVNDDG